MNSNDNNIVLRVENLTKHFGSTVAVKDLSFNLYAGETLGFLGRNGAGKTTTLRCILDLIDVDGGDITIMDLPHTDFRAREEIGYLPETLNFPRNLKCLNLLKYYGQLYGLYGDELRTRADELLKMVGLEDVVKKKIKTFSKGMKKRLGIASVLLHRPKILLLDEPTIGLDPIARVELRNHIKEITDEGTSVLISSHILAEIELEADRVIIIDEGMKIKEGSTEELLIIPDQVIVEVENIKEGLDVLTELGDIIEIEEKAITMELKENSSIDDVARVISESGLGLRSIHTKKVHLDDVFYQITTEGEE